MEIPTESNQTNQSTHRERMIELYTYLRKEYRYGGLCGFISIVHREYKISTPQYLIFNMELDTYGRKRRNRTFIQPGVFSDNRFKHIKANVDVRGYYYWELSDSASRRSYLTRQLNKWKGGT